MAQLNDTMVQGDLRVTGKIYGTDNAIRVEDANLAIPPLGVGNSVGSTGDFFISSGSGKNLPNTVDNFDIHTTVTHYASTTYRLSQIATPTSSSNPAGIYERGASSSDGVTWTFGNWEKMLVSSDLNSVQIPANADLNNYNTDNRIYQCNATNASSVSNRPSGASGAFELEVICGTGNTCVQIYYSRDDVSFNYIRKYTGGNKWTAWNRVSLASDANGAYFATYGSTSHADVLAAVQAEKAVFCISGTDYAPLTGISAGGIITFAKSTTGGVTMYYQLSTEDAWSSGTSSNCRVAFSAVGKSENTSNGCTLTFTAIDGSKKTVTVKNVVKAGNADTVGGYHIVVGSTGTDSKTIYFT